MTYATGMSHHVGLYEPGCASRRVSAQSLVGAVALMFSLSGGAWLLDARLAAAPPIHAMPAPASTVAEAPKVASASPEAVTALAPASAAPKAEAALAPASAAPKVESAPAAAVEIIAAKLVDALLDPAFSLDLPPASFGQVATLGRDFAPAPPAPPARVAEAEPAASAPLPMSAAPQVVENIPLPMARPPEFRLGARPGSFRPLGRRVAQNRPAVLPAAPPDSRNFIEKLFGMPRPTGPALAYATPEDGVFGRARSLTSGPALPYDRWTAVYDIAAHTVYMPDGTRLEAHSGLGDRLDDPRSVHERNRGATPPNVYDLQPREQLFHGVQALRLNPVGEGGTFGRTGLLAHTYMLGPNGDSNGCVSFRNYDAFLHAYMDGEVRHLAVVTRL